jgi:hypothetical protein
MKLLFYALGKVPVIYIKLKSLIKGNSNNAIPYLIISFETESMVADLSFFRVLFAFKISSDLIGTLNSSSEVLALSELLNALAFE